MVVSQEIKEDDFKYCPKCSTALVKRQLEVGWGWGGKEYYLVCDRCRKQYLLQLAVDYG